jgi:hypothetical protein
MGVMADWDNKAWTWRTLGGCSLTVTTGYGIDRDIDHDYEIRQLRVFQTMVDKGQYDSPVRSSVT